MIFGAFYISCGTYRDAETFQIRPEPVGAVLLKKYALEGTLGTRWAVSKDGGLNGKARREAR